jgi:hypothetical protein
MKFEIGFEWKHQEDKKWIKPLWTGNLSYLIKIYEEDIAVWIEPEGRMQQYGYLVRNVYCKLIRD